ncbi:MAG: hypothetical protein KTR31_19010 [Myxococcales bacterium]|nr:hypothetical protein [Myxococcales bacterium]
MNSDMTRKALVDLVRRIIAAEGSEEELHARIALVGRHPPDPSWTDLVYWDSRELTPEQVVDEALAYEPILL